MLKDEINYRYLQIKCSCMQCANTTQYKLKGKTYFTTCNGVEQCFEELDKYEKEELRIPCIDFQERE